MSVRFETQEVQASSSEEEPQASSYMDTFLVDTGYSSQVQSPEEITQNTITGRKRTTSDSELLSSSQSLSQIEVLAKLNLTAEQRILYRSLLSHAMRHKFGLYKRQVQVKDEYLVTSLKREHTKVHNLRCKIKFMQLLQKKRNECTREIFHLGKKLNMNLMEAHRVFAAAMYLYGEDQHWFDQNKALQDSRNEAQDESSDETPHTHSEVAPRISLNLNSHKEAEDFLQRLAVSPLVERIRNEKVWLEQQLDAISSNASFVPGRDPSTLTLVKKRSKDDFTETMQEITQQLTVGNNMLFEELEFKGPEMQTSSTQTTWKPFSGRDILLSQDLIDEFIWDENQNKLTVDRQKKTELSSVLLEAQQGLKYVTGRIKRYKKTLHKETSEVTMIESAFQNKVKSQTEMIEKLKHEIVFMKESSHFMTPDMLDKKRKLERKTATLQAERERDKQEHKLVLSRYDRSLITLQQRIEEYEKHRVLHEMKIKSLNHRLRFYEDSSQKTIISKKKAPRGRVALMFTDIEGSTSAWERNPEAMEKALMLHNKIIRYLIQKNDAFECKTEGDAFMIAAPSVFDAVECALAIQMKLHQAKWSRELLELDEGCVLEDDLGRVMFRGLRVRIGIGVGEPLVRVDPTTGREDYFGPVVNKAARVESFAKGGQIAISQEAFDEIESRLHKLTYKVWHKRLGDQKLKGISGDHGILHILPEVLSHRRWQNLSPVERAMNKLQLENKNMRTKIAELEDKAKHIEAHLRYRETIIEEQEQSMQDLHKKIQKHKLSVKQVESHLDEAQVELERRQVMIDYRTMEVNRLEQANEGVSRENSTLKQVIYVLKRDIDSCEKPHKDVLMETFGGIDVGQMSTAPVPQISSSNHNRSTSLDFSGEKFDSLELSDALKSPDSARFSDSMNGESEELSQHDDDEDEVRSVRSDASFIEHLCSSSRSHSSTVQIGPGAHDGIISPFPSRPQSRADRGGHKRSKRNEKQRTQSKPTVDVVPNIETFTDNAVQNSPFIRIPQKRGSDDQSVFLTNKRSTIFNSEDTSSDLISHSSNGNSFLAAPRFQSSTLSPLPVQSGIIQRPRANSSFLIPPYSQQSTQHNNSAAERSAKEIESLKRQLDFTRSQRDYYRQKAKDILLKQHDSDTHFPQPPTTSHSMLVEEHPTRSHALEMAPTPQPSNTLPSFVSSSNGKRKLSRIGRASTSFGMHATPKRLLKCVEDTVSTTELRKSLQKRSKSSLSKSQRNRTLLNQVNPMDSFSPQTPDGRVRSRSSVGAASSLMPPVRRDISTAGAVPTESMDEKKMKMHYAFF
mmetsp:Transcript_11005/g.40983  ORF Transcript_11005/g.40983 Transcript_11005/m.40983 type:complete len:1300 (-) Transcript_11005:2328-6227(-)